MASYAQENKSDLLRLARRRGLVTQGEEPTKSELVDRLRRHDQDQEASQVSERDNSQDQDQQTDRDQSGTLPPPAVQVGQGQAGQDAADALAAQARGDQPTSQVTGQDVADTTGVSADDGELRDPGRQVGAAEAVAAAEEGNARVQQQADAENLAGYRGINPDPTPNIAYTSEGRAFDMPTPETDAESFDTAQRALRAGGGRFPVTESGVRQAETARAHRLAVDQTRREMDEQVAEQARSQAQEARQGVQDKVQQARQALQS
jgi:hypothetical protein